MGTPWWSVAIVHGIIRSISTCIYRNDMGLEQTAPILAARNIATPDGNVLLLWVCLDRDHVEYEFDDSDDESTDNDLN